MVVSLRRPKLKLRCTICDEVSSYVIYTTRGTRFAHLRWRKRTKESRRRQCGLDDSWWRWLAPPMVIRWQEQDEQTPHVHLLLLRASISPSEGELNSHGKKSLVARVWCCEQKFDEYGPQFIGLLGPTRRGDGVLHFLSTNRTLIQLSLEDFLYGDEHRVGYGMETEFPSWVNSVMENTLSRISSPGLVGLAPGYVSGKLG
jgi:hypothetical protein